MTTSRKVNWEKLQGVGRVSEVSVHNGQRAVCVGERRFCRQEYCLGRQRHMGILSCSLDLRRSSREH